MWFMCVLNGLEHYLADKGFGSLNGKLKALASELKSSLQNNDFMIRFTENSFLVLLDNNHEGNAVTTEENEDANHPALTLYPELLNQFERALNKEIGKDVANKVITFTHEVIPVDSDSESAENLIRSFLMSADDTASCKTTETLDSNVVPFTKKPDEEFQEEDPVSRPGKDELEGDSKKPVTEKVKLLNKQTRQQSSTRPVSKSRSKSASKNQPPKKVIKSGKSANMDTGLTTIPVVEIPDQLEDKNVEPLATLRQVSTGELELALKNKQLKIFYEPLLSVTEIETELYDLGVYLQDGSTRIDRDTVEKALGKSQLAAKLDLWAIENALQIIGDFYNQGLEYRALLTVSASTLLDHHFEENINKVLGAYSLPREILIIDFHLGDLLEDFSAGCQQLNKLKNSGISLCISGVSDTSKIKAVMAETDINLVRLDNSIIANAVEDGDAFNFLQDLIEYFHSAKARVIAGNINTSDLLSICCKARIDLVKGDYIQKEPLPLTADSLSQAMTI